MEFIRRIVAQRLENNIFRYNTDGIETSSDSVPLIANNTFIENTRPVTYYSHKVDSTLYGNTYINNEKNYIELIGDQNDWNFNGIQIWANDGAPYRVTQNVRVRRNNNGSQLPILRIEPGTRVEFNQNIKLQIADDNGNYRGALQADGVTFSRDSEADFYWTGIHFRDASDDSETYLDNCIIEHATDGIIAHNSSHPTISNNIFRNNIDGIVTGSGSRPLIANNTFIENTRPVLYYSHMVDSTLYGNTYINNENNYIELIGDQYDWNFNGVKIWANDGAPYRVTQNIRVRRNNNASQLPILRIEPGTRVEFNQNIKLQIADDSGNYRGALQADGVTFSRDSEADFYWEGIHFRDASDDSETYLDNCIIEHATDGITAHNSSHPTISNNIFRNNIDGIVTGSGSRPLIANNTFIENTRPVLYYSHMVDSTLYGNTYINNENNYIELIGDQYDWNFNGVKIWANDGAPYRVTQNIRVRRNNNASQLPILRIESGTRVEFNENIQLQIAEDNGNYRGALQADGVTFTRDSEADFYWTGIHFRDAADDSESYLNNCIIEYANEGVRARSSSPLLSNNDFSFNNIGIYISNGGALPELSSNRIHSNNTGILLTDISAGVVVGGDPFNSNIFESNNDYAVNNTSDFEVDATHNFWNSPDGPNTENGEIVQGNVIYEPYVSMEAPQVTVEAGLFGNNIEWNHPLSSLIEAYHIERCCDLPLIIVPNQEINSFIDQIDGRYAQSSYRIAGIDEDDNFSVWSNPLVIDNQILNIPLYADSVGYNLIDIRFSQYENSDIQNYNIYRSDDYDSVGTSSLITSISPNLFEDGSYTFRDNTINDGSFYYYYLRLENFNSKMSTFSQSIEVLSRLNPINSISSYENTDGNIVLNWEDNSDSNEGYIISRKIPELYSWTVIDTVGMNDETYTDTVNIDPGISYIHAIQSYNLNGATSILTVSDTLTTNQADNVSYATITSISENEGIFSDTIRINYVSDGVAKPQDWQYSLDGLNWLDIADTVILGI